MRYLLDLETILVFLGKHQESGTLSADLKRFPDIAYRGPCTAQIHLRAGTVVAAIVCDESTKTLVDGAKAFTGLKKLGLIEWDWVPLTGIAPDLARNRNVDMSSFVPRYLIPLEKINKNMLPHRYWYILLLINGSRTVADIAAILARSSSQVDIQNLLNILDDLQKWKIIVIMEN